MAAPLSQFRANANPRPCPARGCAPFTSTRPRLGCRCHAQVEAVAKPSYARQPQQQESTFRQLLFLLAAAPATMPLYLAAYLPAAAEEDATVDAAFSAAAQSTQSTDLIVSVLAALVFGLLLVVTGGVLYLNIKSWLDDRQEKDDQKAPAVVSRVSADSSSSDDEDAPKRTRAVRDKSRGFSRK